MTRKKKKTGTKLCQAQLLLSKFSLFTTVSLLGWWKLQTQKLRLTQTLRAPNAHYATFVSCPILLKLLVGWGRCLKLCRHVSRKMSAGVDGGLRGWSSVSRPGRTPIGSSENFLVSFFRSCAKTLNVSK